MRPGPPYTIPVHEQARYIKAVDSDSEMLRGNVVWQYDEKVLLVRQGFSGG